MEYARREFDAGWTPDADAVNAPPNALLRADNLTLDELGVVSLRQGSDQVNTGAPLSELDVHSLFTIFRDGLRVRYAGAGDSVFRQAVTPMVSGMTGTGDIAFGSNLGQVFFARGTSKFKDDGTTVRNWGISMTGGAPSVSGPIVADTKQYASWDAAETADHVVEEDNGAGAAYADDRTGNPNAAFTGQPETGSGRLVVTRNLAGPTDFLILDGGRDATDDDMIKFWLFASNPNVIEKVTLQIDVNGGTFADDFFLKEWLGVGAPGSDGTVTSPGLPPGHTVLPGQEGPGETPLI
jgi:hypothetical protein